MSPAGMKDRFVGYKEQGEQASEAAAEMVDPKEEQGRRHSSVAMESATEERK